jgi:hypothetical protein
VIRHEIRGMNVRYYLEEMAMAGKYCMREKTYVDKNYEDCADCPLKCGVRK